MFCSHTPHSRSSGFELLNDCLFDWGFRWFSWNLPWRCWLVNRYRPSHPQNKLNLHMIITWPLLPFSFRIILHLYSGEHSSLLCMFVWLLFHCLCDEIDLKCVLWDVKLTPAWGSWQVGVLQQLEKLSSCIVTGVPLTYKLAYFIYVESLVLLL